jgi:hypothetical protein
MKQEFYYMPKTTKAFHQRQKVFVTDIYNPYLKAISMLADYLGVTVEEAQSIIN